MKKTKVFLGGTCNGSHWRERLIPQLTIEVFDPVVKDWDEAAYQRELKAREESDYCLYYITPKMTGVYSIAEVIDDSNKRPEKTIFYIDFTDEGAEFTIAQGKSLIATGKMVEKNGATWCHTMEELITHLNK